MLTFIERVQKVDDYFFVLVHFLLTNLLIKQLIFLAEGAVHLKRWLLMMSLAETIFQNTVYCFSSHAVIDSFNNYQVRLAAGLFLQQVFCIFLWYSADTHTHGHLAQPWVVEGKIV